MPVTPDRSPGELDEEGVVFENLSPGSDPAVAGGLRYVDGAFRARDALGLFDLRGGGFNVGGDVDFLLVNEPPEPNTNYAVTRSGGLVTLETWTRNPGNLLKDIAYTRASGRLSQEDRTIYASDGTTIVGHLRVVYTYAGPLASAVYTRIV